MRTKTHTREMRPSAGTPSRFKRGVFALLCVALFACADSERAAGQGARAGDATARANEDARADALPRAVLFVGLQRLEVEIAATPAHASRGLSGRARLRENTGMYFPFRPRARRSFWMNEMRFDIDILWIRDGRIAEISARVPHGPGRASRAAPSKPVDAALEVNAGTAERWGWKPGTPVVFEEAGDDATD